MTFSDFHGDPIICLAVTFIFYSIHPYSIAFIFYQIPVSCDAKTWSYV